LSLSDVQQLFETWRSREYLLQAAEAGEFHLTQPNVIGAAVNALAKGQLLEKRNRLGETEHRPGSSPASHGRASYVWRATERGKQVARELWHQRKRNVGFFKSPEVCVCDEPGAQLFPLPSRSAVSGTDWAA
jgi:hypothetical protein